MKKYILLTLFLSMGLSQGMKDIKRISEDISETLRHTEIYPDGTLKTVYTYKMRLSPRERSKKTSESIRYIFSTKSKRGGRDREGNMPHKYAFIYKTEYDRNGNLLSLTEGNSYWSIKKDDYEKTFYSIGEKGRTIVTKVEKYKNGKKDGTWLDYLKKREYHYKDGRLTGEYIMDI